MAVPTEISSSANPRMKRLAQLGNRRDRDREGVFVVEGARLVNRALDAGLVPEEVYGDGTVEVAGLEMRVVDSSVLDRVSYRKRSEGLIAVFRQDHAASLVQIELTSPALLLVAEALEKPGNVGAIVRTADAVGADAVVAVPEPVDRFNPNLMRASTGACFTVPVVTATVGQLVEYASASSISVVAADPSSPRDFWDADLSGPVALVVGAEDTGLSPGIKDAAHQLVKVPMTGAIDSLNVSVTMGLLAFEAVRQRSIPGSPTGGT